MLNIDPIATIIFILVCDRLVYPFLRKIGIHFRPITRIAWGFYIAALSMAYAAFVQRLIYSAPPCYDAPLVCDASNGGKLPNQVNVAIQTPAYILIALSEIFASITGLEYAYTKAPTSMKSFIMSIFLLQTAFGSALGIALAPAAKDPNLVWMYSGLAFVTFVVGVIFWFTFRGLNKTEESMNALDASGEKAVKATEMSSEVGGLRAGDTGNSPARSISSDL